MCDSQPSQDSLAEEGKGSSSHVEANIQAEKIATVDTVHQDEALKVLQNYTGDETWTSADEKTLVRKIDRKLLPLLCLTYDLQYYDKAMLSQAVGLLSFGLLW